MASPVAFMESPMCLIENTDGNLSVNQEAVDVLMGLNQPVVVVAVVGLYRTGKSYLMNKLAGKKHGFALGATVQSKTKGIWMWALPHPTRAGHALVLLDTEGLGDVEKGDQKNDAWVFSLAILLSSMLVYNSRGTIDNQAVENLQYVTELTERIKVKSPGGASSAEDDEDGGDAQFVQFFPKFVWAVRDFTLELKIDGRAVTDNEYLEHSLSLRKGRDKKTADYNLPRECIRSYFPTRRCFVFITPTTPENMSRLDSLDECDLSQSFRTVTSSFCSYIFTESNVKTVKGGVQVTGRMLGHLAKTYVDTIARGDVPCLENAVLAMAQIENEAARRDALKEYQQGMQDLCFPVNVQEMSRQHRLCDSLATKTFMSRSFKDDSGEHLKALAEAIAEHYAELLCQNEQASKDLCRNLLAQLSAPMGKKMQEGFYAKPGGYELYCADNDAVVAQFRSTPNKGVVAEEVLEEFLKEKSVESNSVLQADNKLSEQEKRIHDEKQRVAILEQEKRRETERLELAQKMLRDQEESHQETILQLQVKKQKEAAEAMRELEQAMESKLQEHERLMAKGFQRKEEALKEEIQELKNNMEITKEKDKAAQREAVVSMTRVLANGVQTYMEYMSLHENRIMKEEQRKEAQYRLQLERSRQGRGLKQVVQGKGEPNLHQHQRGKPKPGQTSS
ncbi:guanylate-binding protein 1-like isoform X1 [Conger conger]|uniref:guanylate-binding protein 1-like isoform X1 n=1 Tax=Conger conger TaxID=82655 RepID=UPI002A59EC74|nr:guanylate-binding protein 1-like isoform X1 [Conger conger]XP_061094359.1 guanylate-binding protein 1-like isoform X1 [Conger conger]XP_061094368.1 guanylate-binding protein 1-like isoform X1 [Conger conger]XP_061094374.1 guanylate-binding protein 1-like isoform X1 [Conger conger]XP_061094383.1 guanylate-binding protein 1-like isoform X1 [Conger conger]XP_061094392.1 guanylate-binding protein 1-like isoform X1 [Conger conger]XP_061094403.1 guanylate-binding protein 1-like isoform X1 [Conge